MIVIYRGYDIVKTVQGDYAAIDEQVNIVARGETVEKVMDAIDKLKRKQRKGDVKWNNY